MEHQVEIDLTISQRDAISKEVEKLQKDMLAMQWDMQHEKEKLVKTLDAEHVDETASNASAARVMELENKIKSAHLAMLIHVKNTLTADQQRKLRGARDQERGAPAPSAKPAPPPPQKKPAAPPTRSTGLPPGLPSNHDVF